MKLNKEGEFQKNKMHILISIVSLNYVFATVRTIQLQAQRSFRKPDQKGERQDAEDGDYKQNK